MVGLHRCALAAVLVLIAGAATSDANDCLYTYRAEITEVYDGDTVTPTSILA